MQTIPTQSPSPYPLNYSVHTHLVTKPTHTQSTPTQSLSQYPLSPYPPSLSVHTHSVHTLSVTQSIPTQSLSPHPLSPYPHYPYPLSHSVHSLSVNQYTPFQSIPTQSPSPYPLSPYSLSPAPTQTTPTQPMPIQSIPTQSILTQYILTQPTSIQSLGSRFTTPPCHHESPSHTTNHGHHLPSPPMPTNPQHLPHTISVPGDEKVREMENWDSGRPRTTSGLPVDWAGSSDHPQGSA